MIRGIYLNGMTDDWKECLKIRRHVFMNELHCENVEDDLDSTSLHLLLYTGDNKPIGSARLVFDLDGYFQFDYLAVLEEERKNGYGDFIMHMIFDKANQCGADYLVSYDVNHSADYFKKYGFLMEGNRMLLDLKNYFNTHKCCH